MDSNTNIPNRADEIAKMNKAELTEYALNAGIIPNKSAARNYVVGNLRAICEAHALSLDAEDVARPTETPQEEAPAPEPSPDHSHVPVRDVERHRSGGHVIDSLREPEPTQPEPELPRASHNNPVWPRGVPRRSDKPQKTGKALKADEKARRKVKNKAARKARKKNRR